MEITRLETIHVRSRWLLMRVHLDNFLGEAKPKTQKFDSVWDNPRFTAEW